MSSLSYSEPTTDFLSFPAQCRSGSLLRPPRVELSTRQSPQDKSQKASGSGEKKGRAEPVDKQAAAAVHTANKQRRPRVPADPGRLFIQSQADSRCCSPIKLIFMEFFFFLKQQEGANIREDCRVGKQRVEDLSATSFKFLPCQQEKRTHPFGVSFGLLA